MATDIPSTTVDTSTPYRLVVTRQDDGNATMKFYHNGVEQTAIKATAAGWDDAIPWELGTYYAEGDHTRFGLPMWAFNKNPLNREAVQLHARQSPKVDPDHPGQNRPISWSSEGCLVADGAFLNAMNNFINLNGYDDLQIDVVNDFAVNLTVSADQPTVSEGSQVVLTVKLNQSISKDIWVHVGLVAGSQATGPEQATAQGHLELADYSLEKNPIPNSDGDDLRNLKREGITNDAAPSKGFEDGWYVKIPRGQTSAQLVVKALADGRTEGSEFAKFQITDYAVDTPNNDADASERLYSDYKTNPKILITNGGPSIANVTITDNSELPVVKNGGTNYTFERVVHVTAGEHIHYEFEAYSIPDALKISDSKNVYVDTRGLVSGHWGDVFDVKASTNGLMTITVTGNGDPGTLWDILVEQASAANAASQSEALLAFNRGAEGQVERPAGASAAPAPIAINPGLQATATFAQGGAATFTATLVAGHTYSATLVSNDPNAVDPKLVFVDGFATTRTYDNTETNANAAAYFTATANENVTFNASDASGRAGSATFSLNDISTTDLNAFVINSAVPFVVENPSDDLGLQIQVSRLGNVSAAASVSWRMVSAGSNPLTAADFGGVVPSGTVTFAAGKHSAFITLFPAADGLTEGVETADVELFDPVGGVIGTLRIHGQEGRQTIFVGDSYDSSVTDLGTPLDDDLFGSPLADTLQGQAGRDTFHGGAGSDVLTGGPDTDIFIFDTAALTDARAATPVFDRIADYDQGDAGSFSAAEGDQIDLSALLSTAYNHGNGQPVSSLVRAVASGGGADLQIDVDGAANGVNWVTVARLDGIQSGNTLNIILDSTLPPGSPIVVGGGGGGNQAPVLNAGGGSLAYTENQAASAINTVLTVSDADSANLTGATVAISGNFQSGQDILGFTNQNGITGSFNAATGVLTLSGSSSVANYQAALRSVTYFDNSDNPSDAPRTISYQVNDGQASNPASNTVTATVSVTPVNDAPTDINAITLLAVNEFPGNGVPVGTVAARDADNSSFTYTLLNDAAGRFAVDNGGHITVTNGLLLDFEQNPLHVIRVQATDPGGLSFVKDFGITINDVNPENITGDGNSNTFVGGALADNLNGGGGADRLEGRGGDDILDGGPGVDLMLGGTGNDSFVIDNVNDQVIENPGEGRDSIYTTVNYTLSAEVEVLIAQGSADLQLNGNGLANTIFGNTGNNVIDGVGGADIMVGGIGNDAYVVDNVGDVVTENPGEGRDSIYTAVNFTLPGNVEVLIAQGIADLQINGNGLDNTIFGNTGNNVIDGGVGIDIMLGGIGNDSYVVDNVGDVVTENPGEGRDSVYTSVNYTLSGNVEVLIAQGGADLQLNGNGLANTIFGNTGNNVIDGGIGIDIMLGGIGNDSYVVDNVGDVVTENPGEGRDSVYTAVNYTLSSNVEVLIAQGGADLQLNGNALGNTIFGNSGNNVIDGVGGADIMLGGIGNNSYVVDNVGDVVTENPGEGRDSVYTSVNYTLSDNVEVMIAQGGADLQLNGNGLANTIFGNTGNNVIDGGGGVDIMLGGIGNNSYVVDNVGDVVTENSGEGRDSIYTAVNYTLSGNVEVMIAQGGADLQLNGNGLANTIFGNSGNNVIDGVGGADIMLGGNGNNSYVVDNVGDVVTENPGEGRDAVYTTVNYTLSSDVEVLIAQGSAGLQLNGNGLANTIFGNSGNNVIDGVGGADIMIGGLGDDAYVVDNVGDQVVENVGEGRDSVYTTANYTLSSNVEVLIAQGGADLQLNGNALGNTIFGNNGNNVIDGVGGADTMIGGLGDDTYVVDNVLDQVTENPGEGRDAVYTSVNYTLSANVEVLLAQGGADLQLNGNALANTVFGNSGNNVIDGSAGADLMLGGLGDDSYVVDNVLDQAIENPGEGRDAVYTSVNYTLSGNVEVLTAQGGAGLQLNGNGLANTIFGNSGNNVIDGGAGADLMIGGLGDDSYVVDNILDQVTENPGEGRDAVYTTVNYTLSSNVEVLIAQGSADLQLNGNALDNTIFGNSGNNVIDGIGGADIMIGGLGNDSYVVDNVLDKVTENPGEGRDAVYTTVNYTLSGNVEVLIAQGNADLQLNGNTLDNTVFGNGGSNVIDGGAGADIMLGGLGDDSYVVDNVLDQVIENPGEGRDTIYTTVNLTAPGNVEVLIAQGGADLQLNGNGLANTVFGNSGSNVIDGGAGADILIGAAGNDSFVFRSNEANNDTVLDFAGNGGAAGTPSPSWALGLRLRAPRSPRSAQPISGRSIPASTAITKSSP